MTEENIQKTDKQAPAQGREETLKEALKEVPTEDLHKIIKGDRETVEKLNKKVEEKQSSKEEEEVPKKFKTLLEQIEKMSVIDLAELVKVLEKKFGVSASAPVAMIAAGAAPAGDAAAAEEKTSFDVELTEVGGNKIGVIKAVRELTELGLKDAKDLVDGAPKVIKEGVTKDQAEAMKKKIEEAGGKVVLK